MSDPDVRRRPWGERPVFNGFVIGGCAIIGLLMTVLFIQLEEEPRLGRGGMALVVFGQPVVTSGFPAYLPDLFYRLALVLNGTAGAVIGGACCCLIDANLQRRHRVAVTGDNGKEA